MSISGSLANALSGMTATARAAEVVSSNVANALTEGYGRRVLDTSARVLGDTGGGVQVDGVRRAVDERAIAERRLSDADLGLAESRADFQIRLEQSVGMAGDAASLSAAYAGFEAALIEATSRPDQEVRLENVLTAAQTLQSRIGEVSDTIQDLRQTADQGIAAAVDLLNDRLSKIADLNVQIRGAGENGSAAAALMDQRQALIDEISALVPLRQLDRDGGAVALYSVTGAALLDGKAAEFSFAPAGAIVPEMSLDSGALSGLSLNGQPISVSGPYSPIAGGKLAGFFEQRDDQGPQAQAALDAMARDLIERFQDPGLDPTLGAGQAGMFTDAGGALLPGDEVGLAARLQINPALDPAQGGQIWRIRDGVNATLPGPSGDAGLLGRALDAMTGDRIVQSGQFAGSSYSAADLAGAFLSSTSSNRLSAESAQGYAQSRNSALMTAELNGGVDTDQEMQMLLQVEQAYAANARVIQTVSDLIDTLLGI